MGRAYEGFECMTWLVPKSSGRVHLSYHPWLWIPASLPEWRTFWRWLKYLANQEIG
ncbi:MAG: hypothetical protein HOP02_02775 [Methylococcaceae bacterium]|nr:hypothetical protein [Methylococcaceae bacterium]